MFTKGKWTTKDGRVLLLTEMSTDHLMNAKAFLERKEINCSCPYYQKAPCVCGAEFLEDMRDEQIEDFDKELARRAILPVEA